MNMKMHGIPRTARVLAAARQPHHGPLGFYARLAAATAAVLTASSVSGQQHYLNYETEGTGNKHLKLERTSSVRFSNSPWTRSTYMQEEAMTALVSGRIFDVARPALVRLSYRAIHNPSTRDAVDVDYSLDVDNQYLGNVGGGTGPGQALMGPNVHNIASFTGRSQSGQEDSGVAFPLSYTFLPDPHPQGMSLTVSGLPLFLTVQPEIDIFADMTTAWSPTSLNSSGEVQARAKYTIRAVSLLPSFPFSGAQVEGNGDDQFAPLSERQWLPFGVPVYSHAAEGIVSALGWIEFSTQAPDHMRVWGVFPKSSVEFGIRKSSTDSWDDLVNDRSDETFSVLLDVSSF